MKRLVVGIAAVVLVSTPALGKGKPGGGSGGAVLEEPTSLSASGTSETDIDVSWASGGGTTTGFIVAHAEGSAPADCASGTDVGSATSTTLSSLNSGTVYGIRVCSYDGSSTSTGVTTTAATQTTPAPAAANELWRSFSGTGTLTYFSRLLLDESRNRIYGVGGDPNGWRIEARDMTTGELATGFNGTGVHSEIPSQNSGAAIDSHGNLYVCGKGCRQEPCQEASGKGKNATPSTIGFFGARLIKISPAGAQIWDKSFHEDTETVQTEFCQDVAISVEGSSEFLYVLDDDGLGNRYINKTDLHGNLVWSSSVPSYTTPSRVVREIAVGSDGVYVNLPDPANYGYEITKFDKTSGASLASTRGSVTDNRSNQNGMSVGYANGVEYVWFSGLYENTVLRYNTDLTPAVGGGCDQLDTSVFSHHIHTYNISVAHTATGDYLYLPTRRHQHDGVENQYDFGILRFDMTAGGCISDNDPGDLFDYESHLYDFLQNKSNDSGLEAVVDSNGDVYVSGYASSLLGSDGVMVKFSGN